jgi:signal transduction histidine kinase
MMKHIIELHVQAATGLARENEKAFTAMTMPITTLVDLTTAVDVIGVEGLKRAVDNITSSNQHVQDIRIVDENEAVITGSDPANPAENFSSFAGLSALREGKIYKTGIIINDDYKYIMELAWPVARANLYAGFVFARIDFSRLWGGLDSNKEDSQSNIMFVDQTTGRVMADQSRQRLGTVYTPAASKTPIDKSGLPSISRSGIAISTWEEEGQVVSRFKIKDWPMDIVMESRTATLAAHITDNLRFVFMVALGWLFVGFILSYIVATIITKPLRKLAEFMKEIPANMEIRAEHHGGEYNIISDSLNAMLDDIQQKEKQLKEQSAIAAVGRMATVLAHDIRNGLHNILSAATLFSAKPDFAMSIIRRSADKMIAMLNNIMEFARSGIPDLTKMSIEELLAEFHPQLMVDEHFNGRVVKVVPGDPGMTVLVDKSKMLMALDNLTRNSLEAGAQNVTLTWRKNGNGKMAEFIIRDDGPGIPDYILKDIFTPFFSTKRNGFGIGLSVIEMVVKAHNGSVELVKAEGGGAEFRISAQLVGDSRVNP